MPDVLDGPAIDAALRSLPGWEREGNALGRRVELPSFPAAVELVNRVAEIAEERNHHPDIDIRWRTLVFRCSTHSLGQVTDLDVDLARAISGEIDAAGGRAASQR